MKKDDTGLLIIMAVGFLALLANYMLPFWVICLAALGAIAVVYFNIERW